MSNHRILQLSLHVSLYAPTSMVYRKLINLFSSNLQLSCSINSASSLINGPLVTSSSELHLPDKVPTFANESNSFLVTINLAPFLFQISIPSVFHPPSIFPPPHLLLPSSTSLSSLVAVVVARRSSCNYYLVNYLNFEGR